MQNADFNYIRNVFPFLLTSKFNLSMFSEQPNIKNVEISVDLFNNKNLPEVIFWILFSINNKKPYISYFYKKKYTSGKSSLAKVFLTVSKKFGSKKNILTNIKKVFQKMVLLTQEVNLLKSYPYKSSNCLRTFSFDVISFEEKYQSLMTLAPSVWVDYDLKFNIVPIFKNGFYFRFFLQNLQLPVF